MTKVTYLLGAGASYGAVPIVGEMEERLQTIITSLKGSIPFMNINDDGKGSKPIPFELFEDSEIHEKIGPNFTKDLERLFQGMQAHSSVDTYAKKLYLLERTTNQNLADENAMNLDKLKLMLSCFLTLEQMIKPPDYRYDKFLASILQNDILSFPSQMNILSWNYDYQFELAYSDYSKQPLHENKARLNILSKGSNKPIKAGFTIVKLNGSSGITGIESDENYLINTSNTSKLFKEYEDLLELYDNYLNNTAFKGDLTLSFAWEEEPAEREASEKVLYKTKKLISDTDYLVVIGYSFPFFNSEIDLQLLDSMEGLQKVFVQDTHPEKISSSLNGLKDVTELEFEIDTTPSDNLDEFFIPYDFIRERMNK